MAPLLKIHSKACVSRKGSTTVVFVLLLNVVFVLGVFILEYSYLKLAKTELRIAVDACSRAASAEYGVSKDLDAAIAAAQEMASRYRVGRSQFSIEPSDVIVGTISQAESGTYEFLENGTPTNAFRIATGYTDGSVLGALDSLFASFHGVEKFQIQSLSTVAEIDLEVVLVLDRSGSMAFDLSGTSWQYPNGQSWYINYFVPPDSEGSRWAALDSALSLFADVLDQKSKKVPVAVTSYSTNYSTWSQYFGRSFSSVEASVEQSFTTDYQALRNGVGAIGNQAIIGGTSISAGMELAAELLEASPNREYAYQVMIVMTDGQWNAGRHPVLAAQDIANQGVKIFTVAFSNNADIETMQGVADVGGGDLFYAVTQEELEEAFREIAQSLEIVFVE